MDGIWVGLISTVILLINTHPFVVSQPGFISIDCGATEDHFNNVTKIHWTNDNAYSKIGESSALPQEIGADHELLTVRSFPEYKKNCYEINTTDNTKYLLRLRFLYANFDLKSSGQDQSMNLIIDDAIIQRFNPSGGTLNLEFIVTAVSDVTSVCFGKVDREPFVNSIELRKLNENMYHLAKPGTILSIVHQKAVQDASEVFITRYTEDPYDRFWVPQLFTSENRTAFGASRQDSNFLNDSMPSALLASGVKVGDSIKAVGSIDGYEIALTVFFSVSDNQKCNLSYETLNGKSESFSNYSKPFGNECCRCTVKNNYTDSLRKAPYNLTAASSEMVWLYAWHVTSLHYRPKKTTNKTEFDIMRRIREHFNIAKWTGDPCLPVGFTWDKVECDYDGPNATVKSVDLSGMKLHNTVPDLFTKLTSLSKLNLSNNDLHGTLPDSLFKNHLLNVDYINNPKLHKKGLTTTERNILIGIVVAVGIIALFVGFLVCRHIRGLTLEEYIKDTTDTQGGESTKTLKRQLPWSSPIVKKDPSHGQLQLSRNIS